MDFALTEEQQAIFDMARDFGAEHIVPHSRDWERAGTIPKELWPRIAQLGFGGLYVSEDYGGSGLTRLDATLVFEALAMAAVAVLLAVFVSPAATATMAVGAKLLAGAAKLMLLVKVWPLGRLATSGKVTVPIFVVAL